MFMAATSRLYISAKAVSLENVGATGYSLLSVLLGCLGFLSFESVLPVCSAAMRSELGTLPPFSIHRFDRFDLSIAHCICH